MRNRTQHHGSRVIFSRERSYGSSTRKYADGQYILTSVHGRLEDDTAMRGPAGPARFSRAKGGNLRRWNHSLCLNGVTTLQTIVIDCSDDVIVSRASGDRNVSVRCAAFESVVDLGIRSLRPTVNVVTNHPGRLDYVPREVHAVRRGGRARAIERLKCWGIGRITCKAYARRGSSTHLRREDDGEWDTLAGIKRRREKKFR